jgi:molybdate transport system substrate-binding protein
LAAFLAVAAWRVGGAEAQPDAGQNRPVLIFAAASLQSALDEIARQWRGATRHQAVISYAATSALARQIEQGAPADVFISADLDWMDYLARRDLIRPGTRTNLLGNRLVVVAPRNAALRIVGLDIAGALDGGKLAMANLDAVPAGKYGKAALENLGIWSAVRANVVQTDHVRGALVLVARGEARLGIVYQSDAEVEAGVRIVTLLPENSHPPVIYPVAVLRDSRHRDAASFVDYLRTLTAVGIFEWHGFTVLN